MKRENGLHYRRRIEDMAKKKPIASAAKVFIRKAYGCCEESGDKVIKHMEQKILQVLIKTLEEFHISERSYSLGEYAEETICLVKNDSSWYVYGGEKGIKHDIKIHADCKDACLDLLARIAESNDDEKKLTDFFIAECERT